MAAKSKRASKSRTGPDAISVLERDHATLRGLLAQMDKTTARGVKKRMELLTRIADEVRRHAKLEEQIFYPAYHAAAEKQEDSKLYFEATEEHGLVDVILPELEDEAPASEVFAAKAKVLKDLIEHHAEEEESEMFPRAKKLLGAARLKELGEEIEAARPTILETSARSIRARAKASLGRAQSADSGRPQAIAAKSRSASSA